MLPYLPRNPTQVSWNTMGFMPSKFQQPLRHRPILGDTDQSDQWAIVLKQWEDNTGLDLRIFVFDISVTPRVPQRVSAISVMISLTSHR